MATRYNISVYAHGDLVERHEGLDEECYDNVCWTFFWDDYETYSPYKIVVDRKWDDNA